MSLKIFKQKSYIGVDIGHHTVKVAAVERIGPGWRVTHVGSAHTPPDSLKEGVVADAAAIGQAIREACRNANLSPTAATVSVAGGQVVVRTVRVPSMPEAMLRKSIRLEAGRYVPNSVEDSYIEFEIIGYSPDGQMDVMIVAAPRELVESRLRACDHAGLDVDVVDIEPFAASRSIIETDLDHSWHQDNVALIDIGSNSTNVSVISRGQFSMTRSIAQGGLTMTQALKTYFKLSDEEAEAGKAQLDFRELLNDGTPRENPPLRILQPHADELVREMRRSLNYFQSQQSESGEPMTVNTMVVTGGGAKLPGLAEYMGAKLGLSVVSIGVLDNPRFSYAGGLDVGSGMEFVVATGLAMRPYLKAA